MKRAWRTVEVWQCGKLGFFEENPREALGEGAQLQWRPQCFGDATSMGQLPRAETVVEWSWPVPRRKLYCHGWQRRRNGVFGRHRIVFVYQTASTEPIILLSINFVLF